MLSFNMDCEQQDLFFMHYALAVGDKGQWTAPPNPWVGCVIVRSGVIVGEGYHHAPGEPHAEIMALRQAGLQAKGATVYVTLEPCGHYGRTPPCCPELIQAGVKRVVFPVLDPDPRVAGRGKKKLEEAGIEVTCGVGAAEAEVHLAAYLHHRRTARPYCIVKIASSVDGKAAAADGSSQWITGEAARHNAHELRASSQAIMVGSRTACLDNPRLTVRGLSRPHQTPLRVVLDPQGKVPLEYSIFDTKQAPSLVFLHHSTPHHTALQTRGVQVEILPETQPLEFILDTLGKRGVLQLLIEGGPTLQAAFLKQQLVQKCCVYLGARLLGVEGELAFRYPHACSVQESVTWRLESVGRFGDDVRLDYLPPARS